MRRLLLFLLAISSPALRAQMPFYTDDTEVTAPGTLHLELFDELDGLQSSQYPDLRQNTANLKMNTGLPHGLELDLDAPLLTIYRAGTARTSQGLGDTEFGVKWKLADAVDPRPALAATFYIEVPTGDARRELGSGVTDYWLNFIAQERLSARTRVNVNLGVLFAGNTSTGVLGIRTTRGRVLTGGASVLHDVDARLTVGAEVYGGLADDDGLQRTQLQALCGGQYRISGGVALSFALLGGRFAASPHVGGQLGIAIDLQTRSQQNLNALGRSGPGQQALRSVRFTDQE